MVHICILIPMQLSALKSLLRKLGEQKNLREFNNNKNLLYNTTQFPLLLNLRVSPFELWRDFGPFLFQSKNRSVSVENNLLQIVHLYLFRSIYRKLSIINEFSRITSYANILTFSQELLTLLFRNSKLLITSRIFYTYVSVLLYHLFTRFETSLPRQGEASFLHEPFLSLRPKGAVSFRRQKPAVSSRLCSHKSFNINKKTVVFSYETVNINLSNKPEWLYDKSFHGKIPALELETGDVIYGSLIIPDYLDGRYSQNPLHSADPLQKTKDRLLIEQFSQVNSLQILKELLYLVY